MRKILVAVQRDDEWSATLQAIRTDHYHMLHGRSDVVVKEDLDLLLKSPGGNLLTFEARVIRVTPGKGAALEVYERDERKPRGWRRERAGSCTMPFVPELDEGQTIKEFLTAPGEFDSGVHETLSVDTAERTTPDLSAPVASETDFAASPGPEPDRTETLSAEVALEPSSEGDPGEGGGAPEPDAASTVHARLHRLSVTEKQKAATTGDRVERGILARDNLKQVHLFVLKNPKVQDDEVLEYAKYAGLSPQALTYIAENARWMRSAQLRFTLVRNPQVPADVARRVIETLSVNEIRFLAKAEHVKSDVRLAARKALERKGLM